MVQQWNNSWSWVSLRRDPEQRKPWASFPLQSNCPKVWSHQLLPCLRVSGENTRGEGEGMSSSWLQDPVFILMFQVFKYQCWRKAIPPSEVFHHTSALYETFGIIKTVTMICPSWCSWGSTTSLTSREFKPKIKPINTRFQLYFSAYDGSPVSVKLWLFRVREHFGTNVPYFWH